MKAPMEVWKSIAGDDDADIEFVIGYLEFIELLWGKEVEKHIDEWMC